MFVALLMLFPNETNPGLSLSIMSSEQKKRARQSKTEKLLGIAPKRRRTKKKDKLLQCGGCDEYLRYEEDYVGGGFMTSFSKCRFCHGYSKHLKLGPGQPWKPAGFAMSMEDFS